MRLRIWTSLLRHLWSVSLVCLAVGLPPGCGCGSSTPEEEAPSRRTDRGTTTEELVKTQESDVPPTDSVATEELVLTKELTSDASGISYKVDVYYNTLHNRLRVEVYADGTHLKNLRNRLRVRDLESLAILGLKRQEGVDVLAIRSHGTTFLVRLQEEPFDIQAMYDALEKYVEEHEPEPRWREVQVRERAGLLEDVYLACIGRLDIHPCPPARFLITEEGTITHLTPGNLVIAYRNAGIEAAGAEDRERIARSILELIEPGAVIISGPDDIPGYEKHPLDADVETTVRAPWSYQSEDGTAYWIAYTYARCGGSVTRYKVRFFEGRLIGSPVDELVLGVMIGDYYLPM